MKALVFVLTIVALAFADSLAQVSIRVGERIECFSDASPQNFDSNNPISNDVNIVTLPNKIENGRTAGFGSQFEVKFIGFPADAQAAVQKAIDIWALTLKSRVKIRIFANWSVLQNPGTLAFVVPTEVRNFPGNPNPNLWYPMSLAEKLIGNDINADSEADIVATFNAGRTDWYFGTDGNPAGKFDLVTIALHEIGHGLGFSPTFRVSSSLGFVGSSDGNPKIYDKFLVNGNGDSLLNQSLFTNGSAQLGIQLTGNSLLFESEIAKTLNSGGSYPRIYAPNPFNGGSSISHLDETQYNGTKNKLMTPFVNPGEVQHDVGPLVRGMFYDMGWLNTTLDHQNIGDQESLAGKKFLLTVNSDTTILSSSVKLIYSFDGFTSSNSSNLTSPSSDNLFETKINSPQIEKTVSYYFICKDLFGRQYRYPLNGVISFYLGIDTKKPIINHTTIPDITEFDRDITFRASVTDNIGLARVYLEYQVNGLAIQTLDMTEKTVGNFEVKLDLATISPALKQGDKMNYRIVAVDNSSQSNTSFFPSSNSATINVRTFDPVTVYLNDFSIDRKDFIGDFSISTPTGFVNGAIHSPHPYPKSSTTNPIDLNHVLLYPIKIRDKDSFMTFDEVALVEPGMVDDYTLPAFGDYVIVEGSKDRQSWKPLVSGYDSRRNLVWLNYYNSSLVANGDSQSIGTLNYYRNTSIDMLKAFSSNDIIYIRFRLRSDAQKAGWGWAIDNLNIQDQVVGVEDAFLPKYEVYPNPFSDKVIVESPSRDKYTKVIVYSLFGEEIGAFPLESGRVEIDTTFWPPAFFIFKLVDSDNSLSVLKKIVKVN